MDSLIEGTLEQNRGFISRTELLDIGNSDKDIRDAVAAGVLERVRRGYYASAQRWRSLSPEARHVVLVRIAARRFGPGVAVCGASAEAVRQRSLWDQDLDVVDVVRLDGRSGGTDAGVCHHVGEIDPGRDLEVVDGLVLVREPCALWQAACTTSVEGALVTFDSALHDGPYGYEALEEYGARFLRWGSSRCARLAFRLADGRSESAGESRGRYLFWQFHIPKPDLQHTVRTPAGRLLGYTDYAWLDGHHLGEFDGLVKYQRLMREGESPSDVVIREKRREDEMRSGRAGMSRLVWFDLTPPQRLRTAERVRREIEQSRRDFLHNRVSIAV